MAHELADTNGIPSMAYFGETPWHRLGTKLNETATAAEAIVAAGLNYQADLKSIQTLDGKAVTQRKAVVRSDTGDVLGERILGSDPGLTPTKSPPNEVPLISR